jgi:phospholipase C
LSLLTYGPTVREGFWAGTKEDTLLSARLRGFRLALIASAAVFSLPLFVAGCGAPGVNKETAGPQISVTANPTSINAGGSSTLTIAVANATSVTLTGSDGSTYSMQPGGGTQAVKPTATTTYTATATGAKGRATATATVTVVSANAPTVSITGSPASIIAGSSALLTITANNATQVTVTGTDGSSYNLAASGGTQAVTPAATTTYTATASGAGGSATATTIITVTANPAPTVTILANPPSITAGSSSTLTVTAVNATLVTITGSDGSSYPIQQANGGTQSVSPTATTNYTATATGPGGTASASVSLTVTANPAPSITIVANPTTIVAGNPSILTITAANAMQVTVTGTDGSSYNLPAAGGNQSVTPSATATYKATATGAGGTATASATVTVTTQAGLQSVNHVVFMLQENHSFDNYFGMLNPYRQANGWSVGDDGVDYEVDGIDGRAATFVNEDDQGTTYSLFPFTSTCVDDMSSDWLSSYGDVDRYNFTTTRPIALDGFVHDAEGYANSCVANPSICSGSFTDTTGERAMGYYDQNFLNYYYYMAAQFAVSDRWFSPVASKSIDNRIATFTGGTTQGLIKDPGGNDQLPQLNIPNIFQELDQAKVSWKVYYTVTQGYCLEEDDCAPSSNARYPATDFSNLTYSFQYIHANTTGACTPPTQLSSVVGDSTNSFCIDPDHIAPISQYYTDLTNGTLPSFAFIEAGYGNNDEHPGSGQTILYGQAEVAKVVAALTSSAEWKDSVFFFSYDEGGGPYDHVPPVPGHSNDNTNPNLGAIPDIGSISVNPDVYNPCVPPGGTPTTHCDLATTDPGANPGDAAAAQGFGAQLGFRLPNIVISPFTRRHYVSHVPMDHTAVIKFVETRFIGSSAHLTARDAAQPNLLDFFDFTGAPWSTPPTPPVPNAQYKTCTPASFAPAVSQRKTSLF